MADPEPEVREIIIIRRRGGDGEDGHHGGAWKIAFADFMTAMMAFFLVLWIVNSTSKETRASVARYFNPVKLADTTPARKGLQDPRETDFDASGNPTRGQSKSEEASESKGKDTPAGKAGPKAEGAGSGADAKGPSAEQRAATLEMRLFEEPQAVLNEIVAAGLAQEAAKLGDHAALTASDAPYRDPFASVEPVLTPKLAQPAPMPARPAQQPPSTENAGEAEARPAPARQAPVSSARKADASPVKEQTADEAKARAEAARQAQANAQTDAQADARAQALQNEIMAAFANEGGRKDTPSITVKADKDGLLISLTDKLDFSMFAVGSATPHHRMVQAVEKISAALKARSGKVIVRGYTDARPFRKGASDNWRLSSSRAQAAFYMLVRGGVPEQRLERVEGHGDRNPRNAADPLAPENRRVEILLRGDAP